MTTKIAVTGYKGRLGSKLVNLYGCIPLPCNVKSESSIIYELDRVKPDIVINCAAYTNVDGSMTPEGELESLAVNLQGAIVLHHYCMEKGIRFVQISTAFVFNNKTYTPYTENDVPISDYQTMTPYAYYKSMAEEFILDVHKKEAYSHKDYLIIRIISPFGDLRGNDPLIKILKGFESGKEFAVSGLYYRNFTHIDHIAEGVFIASQYPITGILHIASSYPIMNEYMFARSVNKEKRDLVEMDIETVFPKRPFNATLDVTKAIQSKIPIYTVYEGIDRFLYEYKNI